MERECTNRTEAEGLAETDSGCLADSLVGERARARHNTYQWRLVNDLAVKRQKETFKIFRSLKNLQKRHFDGHIDCSHKQTDVSGSVDVSGHDADLALARLDDTRAVGAYIGSLT